MDEVCNIKLRDFDEQTFSILEAGIQNLSFYVKVNSDKRKNSFALGKNKQFCDVLVIPVLLLYIAQKNFTFIEKNLFPGDKWLQFSHNKFNKEVKKLLINVLKKVQTLTCIFVTHIWQKSANAFALPGKCIFIYIYNIFKLDSSALFF